MLDAAHAGLDGGHRALVAMRVGFDGNVFHRRFLHDRANLFLRVHLLARIGVGRPERRYCVSAVSISASGTSVAVESAASFRHGAFLP